MRKREAIERDPDRTALPESRLYGAMFGAPLLPIGLFCYSFTQYAFVSYWGPLISLAPIAVGIFFFFESTYSYTSDVSFSLIACCTLPSPLFSNVQKWHSLTPRASACYTVLRLLCRQRHRRPRPHAQHARRRCAPLRHAVLQ